MKKTVRIIFLLFIGTAMAFQNPQPGEIRIKRMVNLKTGSTSDYTYDSQGRISTVQNSKGAKITYLYTGNEIIKQLQSGEGAIILTDTFILNGKNRVAVIANGTGTESKFEYDSKGRLIQSVQYYRGKMFLKAKLTWEGENLKTYIASDENGSVINHIDYTYYPEKLNTISEKNMGREFVGQDSKLLVRESVATVGISKVDTAMPKYRYQFNPNGSVRLKIVYNISGAIEDSTAYTYY